MPEARRIAVLGSTGSIGLQTLEVIDAFPDRFRVAALACQRSADAIISQARKYRPSVVAISDPDAAGRVSRELARSGTRVIAGADALVECATLTEADVIVAAATGIAGLRPVWEAVRAGKTVALANKEPIVVAGHLIVPEAARSGAQLLPVDSEHSAIFQLLLGQDRSGIARVVLTASGGAFRDLPEEHLAGVTPEQALAHPTWKMGPKVTVDSATLMNKGLEIIEARWLFGLAPEQLSVMLHPESIVHSLVEFIDGSVLAQLARPDMRLPIQFALSYPERWLRPEPPVDLTALGALHFSALSEQRWPCVRLAREALAAGGTAPAALNAADEVAVSWFLGGRIRFTEIAGIVERALDAHRVQPGGSVEELLAVDAEVRRSLMQGNGGPAMSGQVIQ
jgi:1-deoxy-D-xylulose-5-phosphate reductoisomerase